MLKEKYGDVLSLGEEIGIKNGYVKEEEGKLKIGGTAVYQYDCDRIWDKLKNHSGWEKEVEMRMDFSNSDVYGVYTVVAGDTLSKISKKLFGNANRYMEIFNVNKDVLTNPDLIKVGQELKLPSKHEA